MFKKVFGVIVAMTFVFSLAPQISKIDSSISNVCSCTCCEHDGDVWDN